MPRVHLRAGLAAVMPLYLHDQAKPGVYFFPLNYSISILKTFQGEHDPGTRSSTRSVPQSRCQVLTFPTSCSGMGAGPWPLPAMGHRRNHLRRNNPKTGWLGGLATPDAPARDKTLTGKQGCAWARQPAQQDK